MTLLAAPEEVFEAYARDRGPRDREWLVERFLPLARHLARRYATSGEIEDLEQVASLALLKAIDRYDPQRGIAFTSFAVPTILGELKRYFRDNGWTVRVPRSVQELVPKVTAATTALTTELRRAPTASEIADRCGISIEQVVDVHQAASAHHPDSLDRPLAEDRETTVVTQLGGADPGYERAERAIDLQHMLTRLDAREREVLRLRFDEDLVQREIGERLGISQMHVSRLISRAIAKLNR
jgi:RNA polymerase sigma-B factor